MRKKKIRQHVYSSLDTELMTILCSRHSLSFVIFLRWQFRLTLINYLDTKFSPSLSHRHGTVVFLRYKIFLSLVQAARCSSIINLRFFFQSESKETMKDRFFIFSNGMFSLILCQVLEMLNPFNHCKQVRLVTHKLHQWQF